MRKSVSENLKLIENVFIEHFPDIPFQYDFVDEQYAEKFQSEERIVSLASVFTGLAILISCLGLFGLTSFVAEQRTKEIGIRKVMGAKVTDIVKLLIWQFSKPVLLANIIAWPIVCYFMLAWLQNFPYRIEAWYLIPICLFVGVMSLIIAWLTVGGNAAKVANKNPVNSLRYE